MKSIILVIMGILVTFSMVVTVDLHSKIQYTSYRDHMRIIWWSGFTQFMVLMFIVPWLFMRHVRLVNVGW
jgi:uncharacterized membrane protein YkvI